MNTGGDCPAVIVLLAGAVCEPVTAAEVDVGNATVVEVDDVVVAVVEEDELVATLVEAGVLVLGAAEDVGVALSENKDPVRLYAAAQEARSMPYKI